MLRISVWHKTEIREFWKLFVPMSQWMMKLFKIAQAAAQIPLWFRCLWSVMDSQLGYLGCSLRANNENDRRESAVVAVSWSIYTLLISHFWITGTLGLESSHYLPVTLRDLTHECLKWNNYSYLTSFLDCIIIYFIRISGFQPNEKHH